ncbi:hypothetical protein [Neisseria iguanae]|uniref:Uncharacterized protein n=1 Tax=Neisseria iguanae TaxID=90242 RepID=A0A2P7TY59_9NEIS|nr:hypothetical protein [Neisseria iguanae]PSJ79658.1 hypothetical protein C7N83_10935 [Neisseria iguanae]
MAAADRQDSLGGGNGSYVEAQLFDGQPIKYLVGFDERRTVNVLSHRDLGLLVEEADYGKFR